METKQNISEILKYFPKGTKLYSPICGEVEFIEVASSNRSNKLCYN